MKVQFITTPAALEKANYLLERAIQSCIENEAVKKRLGLSDYDLHSISTFRKDLVKGFLKTTKGNGIKSNE